MHYSAPILEQRFVLQTVAKYPGVGELRVSNARVNIGLQGVALSERAHQGALAYARERVQSARFGAPSRRPVRIIEHADVRRMLLTMKASTEAIRALTYLNATAVDRAHNQEDVASLRAAQGLADLLTPIAG